MKKAVSVVMVLALVVVFAHVALGQDSDAAAQPVGPMPGGVVANEVTSTAIVMEINAEQRVVTLKFADRSAKAYKLGPEVRNFDQLKVGDQVRTTLVESVALFIRKPSEEPFAGQVQTVQVAAKGAKPGVITTDTSEIRGTVEAIDYAARTVTLKGPGGNMAICNVDESVKNFKNVSLGDEIVLRVTNAMALVVEKAK